jgi:hypothetical protein
MLDTLNDFIDGIRNEAESQKFKKYIYEHQRLITENHKSLMKYIDGLFKKRSRLLVLRVDLSYRKDIEVSMLSEDEINNKYQQAKKDRENFLNNRRSNKLFEHLVGYAWKLEFASLKGFHYHMIFFFNSSMLHGDVNLAKNIGEYWAKTITKGNGLYYNCNANKGKYKTVGIGAIHCENHEQMKGLELAARYLTKPDYYAKINAPNIGKTFAKGGGITKSKGTRGRPRKHPSELAFNSPNE